MLCILTDFKKTILVTGGAGFIGSNLVNYWVDKYPQYFFINLDKLTYAANLEYVRVAEAQNYRFIQGDICDRVFVEKCFAEHGVTDVIHLAAESHVDNSIEGPEAFIRTNINGTFTLLDVARKAWMDGPRAFKIGFENSRFYHVSTDEVYGSLGETGAFLETTPYAPNSPYSASKASSDMLVRSYQHTYGMKTLISNCSNNYGPHQHNEKLIPTIIRKALGGEPIPIYGAGTNVRDWLFVEDHVRAIDVIFHSGVYGETYNVGGECEKMNLHIAQEICAILDEKQPKASGKYEDQITFVSDRPGHDFRYAIDCSKLKSNLDWTQDYNFNQGIAATVDWYLKRRQAS